MANGPVADRAILPSSAAPSNIPFGQPNNQFTGKKRQAITSQPIDQPMETRQAQLVNKMDNPEFAEDLMIGGS